MSEAALGTMTFGDEWGWGSPRAEAQKVYEIYRVREMGQQSGERELFSYAINLEKRVRSDHPLRRIAAAIDFKFVREEVAQCYGSKGNVSVDPTPGLDVRLSGGHFHPKWRCQIPPNSPEQ